VTYAGLDEWTPAATTPASEHILDRWIRSRLHRTIATVTGALDAFDSLSGAQALAELVDDLSNWYVRRSRPRFWKSSDPAAHATLHACLTTISQLLAPYCPFITDEMYANLTAGSDSVHVTDWPAVDESALDDDLEAEMAIARQLVSLGRAARGDAKIGVRQPLPRAIALLGPHDTLRADVVQEVADELNVKRFEVVTTLEGLLSYHATPNFRALGPRVGKRINRVKELLAGLDGAEVKRAFDEQGFFDLDVDGEIVRLEPDDVEIRAEEHEELALAQDGRYAVALDLTLDDDLRSEGKARELSRAVNDLRKTSGFEISDRVVMRYSATGDLAKVVDRHRDWIMTEVLATEITASQGPPLGTATGVEIAGETIFVELTAA
jgi:isoleucyl-tRNA synthetase